MSLRYKGGVLSATPPTPSTTSAGGNWTLQQQMQAVAAGNWPPNGPFWIEDVFSTYLYTGNGSTQTITNGIDLSGKGGLVWAKRRNGITSHVLMDTARGTSKWLESNNNPGDQTATNYVTAFNSNGFSVGDGNEVNDSSRTFASWTFRKQAKFFDVVTYTGNGASNRQISHNLGSAPGCIIVKCTSAATNWPVYHRSLASTEVITLNLTNAKETDSLFGNTTPTSTYFVVSGTDQKVNANGDTYVAYLFAHDAGGFGASGSDNVISCGSFSTTTTWPKEVNLGYEPQWVMIKRTNSTSNWAMWDTMRGMSLTMANDLAANSTNAEGTGNYCYAYSQGFGIQTGGLPASSDYIYIAIRRGPMRTPTSGTSVFAPTAYSGNNAQQTFQLGFNPDAFILRRRDSTQESWMGDRLRGTSDASPYGPVSNTASTAAESTTSSVMYLSSASYTQSNTIKTGSYTISSLSGATYVDYAFARAPGFFDVVCYTGTGSATTISHNLGVVPEMMIVKGRTGTYAGSAWPTYHKDLGNNNSVQLQSDLESSSSSAWNNTTPTASVFSLGAPATSVNGASTTYVAYLFASVAGVSKVGSYTGNGSSQTINCGFTGGSRFVLIKRTDSTGNWYVFDSARGIVAGNDPYLLLNSTSAEVTTYDAVDTDSTGFIVNNDNTNYPVNVNTATYIFLAIA